MLFCPHSFRKVAKLLNSKTFLVLRINKDCLDRYTLLTLTNTFHVKTPIHKQTDHHGFWSDRPDFCHD